MPRIGPFEITRGKRDDKAMENRAVKKAMDAVTAAIVYDESLSKSFLSGNAAVMSPSRMPGSSWSNQGGTSSALIARVSENLASSFGRAPEELEQALATQGLSWGPPFPPGRPLDPFYGYKRSPRTWNYTVGENVQVTPRWGRISFPTIRGLWDAYDVAQICTTHLINDVISLDYHWEPSPGIRDDVTDDILSARQFFDAPDKEQPFREWLFEWLMDVVRYDAGCLSVRRNEGGDPIALEVVNGATMLKLIDFYGRTPSDEDDSDPNLTPAGVWEGEITPAYVQIIEGMPWGWHVKDDIIYQPWHPQPDSQYGRCALESVLLSANTDLRFQWHFLQYFTEGSIPQGFMEAPPELSDPVQITEWQQTWDALMLGDQSKLRQIRWVPAGAKYTPVGPATDKFDPEFPLYLMRRVCAAFGITPSDLGFTETVNKATSETQVDVQFRVGTLPLIKYVEDVINLFLTQQLNLKVRLRFDVGREVEDRLATAQAEGVYLDHGVVGIDEIRTRLGYPIDRLRPSPRYINNARSGPIPVLSLMSMSGATDPETFGPTKDQKFIDHPFVGIPGVLPVQGSQDQKNAANSEAAFQANQIADASGQPPPNPEDPTPSTPAAPLGDDAVKDALAYVDRLLAMQKEGEGGASAGGPGITASTGMTGVDLRGKKDDEDEEEDDDVEKAILSLRRWKENSRNRVRKGLTPRRFVDPALPPYVTDTVWRKLSSAKTREEVDGVFADPLGKAQARLRPGDEHKEAIRSALRQAFVGDVQRNAIRAAFQATKPVEKSASRDAAKTAALHVLLGAGVASGALQTAVSSLWSAAGSAGAARGAGLVGVDVPADVSSGSALSAITSAGSDVANGLAFAMLYEMADAIATGASSGMDEDGVLGSLDDVFDTRADLISQNEWSQADNAGALDVYQTNNVMQLEWVGGTCAICSDNADASPIDIGDDWPSGDPPCHPSCDCEVEPVSGGE